MGSSSSAQTKQESTNVAIDKSSTNGTGQQILNSIIVDASDTVMVETVKQHKQTFALMMENDLASLSEMMDMGSEIIRLVENGDIRMEEKFYQLLKAEVQFLEIQQENGAYLIDFTEETVGQSFTLAETVAGGNRDLTEQALELVASVKGGNEKNQLATVAFLLTVFGLGALFIQARKG